MLVHQSHGSDDVKRLLEKSGGEVFSKLNVWTYFPLEFSLGFSIRWLRNLRGCLLRHLRHGPGVAQSVFSRPLYAANEPSLHQHSTAGCRATAAKSGVESLRSQQRTNGTAATIWTRSTARAACRRSCQTQQSTVSWTWHRKQH